MATLQNIRSKGPLLVIVIGLALFAFIAGDAWKVLQPHQSHDVGEVNGESLSAQDYQSLVEEYTEVVKFSRGTSALTDEENNQIKDEVWRNYVNNKLIENEAKKLGLSVSKAELQSIIDAGVHPMLQQTPFRNPQTGAFDKDMLKKFLVDYSKMNTAQMPAQYAEYYQSMYKFWSFLEKQLVQTRLAEKYQALVSKSLFSNPVEAQDAFNARADQSDMLLAAIPYSSIVDSTVTITDADLKADTYIYGVSTWDGRYSAFLNDTYKSSLVIEDATLTSDANGEEEYFDVEIADGHIVKFNAVAESSTTNPTAPVQSTLTITAKDMYGHDVVIKLPMTVNKR